VPYKRVDLIAAAFAALPGKRLKVIGDGLEARRLRRHAPPNVEFLGFLPDAEVRDTIGRARAFIFMAEEDFGIAPVEAQMAGTPVIAFGRGGCAETIRSLGHATPTGVLFNEQTAASLTGAIGLFERYRTRITPEACRANAERFSEFNFRQQFSNWVGREWESFTRREMRPVLVSNGAPAPW
jgi:glycosyltransferase involved in cell wall biosynthesis